MRTCVGIVLVEEKSVVGIGWDDEIGFEIVGVEINLIGHGSIGIDVVGHALRWILGLADDQTHLVIFYLDPTNVICQSNFAQ
ncbi:hypothetical protein ACH5RR_013152 [Cinchona calisaya]|uniref:Uncharacterized protein n=1 Tax=Cinchona calisaya TaxID=153742 RepID=A0ABD2ZZ84_9GENT